MTTSKCNENELKTLIDNSVITFEQAVKIRKELANDITVGVVRHLLRCCRRGGFEFNYTLNSKDLNENSVYLSEYFKICDNKQSELAEVLADLSITNNKTKVV